MIIFQMPLINFWWSQILNQISKILRNEMFFLHIQCFEFFINFFGDRTTIEIFWHFWKEMIFENYLSGNSVIKNRFMSVRKRLAVFEIVISPKSIIRFNCPKFLATVLGKYYHLKVSNVYFWLQTSEL